MLHCTLHPCRIAPAERQRARLAVLADDLARDLRALARLAVPREHDHLKQNRGVHTHGLGHYTEGVSPRPSPLNPLVNTIDHLVTLLVAHSGQCSARQCALRECAETRIRTDCAAAHAAAHPRHHSLTHCDGPAAAVAEP